MSEHRKHTPIEGHDVQLKSFDRRAAMKQLGKYSLTASAVVYTLTAKGDASSRGCERSGGTAAGCT